MTVVSQPVLGVLESGPFLSDAWVAWAVWHRGNISLRAWRGAGAVRSSMEAGQLFILEYIIVLE